MSPRPPVAGRRPGISLGRLAGVPVYLAPSWFVVAVVVVVVFAPQVEGAVGLVAPTTYLVAAAYAVLLLVSVLVHEFAHALTARALGLPVQEVVADLWGGHTQFTDDAPTPGRSALVAVVGPLANGALAGLGLLVLPALQPGGVPRLLAVALVFSNAFVAVFNLAPGLPLDGGRVVESLVWAVGGRRWAGTLAAGWCGRVVAVAVVLWGIGLPLLSGRRPSAFTLVWSLMIAALLWQGAGAAVALGRLRRGAERLDLARYTEAATGYAVGSADWQRADLGATGHAVAVDPAGMPVGLLRQADADALARSAQPPAPGTPLAAVMTTLTAAVVRRGESGDAVLRLLATTSAPALVVVDEAGRVVGLADSGPVVAALTGR
ncbi:hypothetical protein GCM10027446_07550 [Angustibacter peucedani]